MSKPIKRELDIEDYEETDRKVILGYINNEVKRFKTFVTNRNQTINENSNIKQWKYILSKDNPDDDGLKDQLSSGNQNQNGQSVQSSNHQMKMILK